MQRNPEKSLFNHTNLVVFDRTFSRTTMNMDYDEKRSKEKLSLEKFLAYSKAFGLEGVFTGRKLQIPCLPQRNHRRSTSITSKSQIPIKSSVIGQSKSPAESSSLSPDTLPLIPDSEFEAYSRQATNKCAHWLMKHVFQSY